MKDDKIKTTFEIFNGEWILNRCFFCIPSKAICILGFYEIPSNKNAIQI